MENNQTNSHPYPGAVPMVRIDGAKIRQLRESKKLTQLYLSTVVGVTTDTISRWENRHYQSIKLENAEKLAQALEVPFDAILKQEEQKEPELVPPAADDEMKAHPPAARRPIPLLILALFFIALAAGVILYSMLADQPQISVSAERILPPHVPAGEAFPVLIRVASRNESPVSLIIKESFPPGTVVQEGSPSITSIDTGENSLKWVRRTETNLSVYAYMCRVSESHQVGDTLSFSGTVTLKHDVSDQYAIMGAETLTVAPYHWADANRDNTIDDEEILSVYDTYSDTGELHIDRDLIDTLWASSRYDWDQEKKVYVPVD